MSIDDIYNVICVYLFMVYIEICVLLMYNRDSEKGAVYERAREKGGIYMAIRYKLDILEALKSKGFSTYKLRKDKLLSEGVIQSLRSHKMISLENVGQLCALLDCQPGDLLEYVKDETIERDNQKNQ